MTRRPSPTAFVLAVFPILTHLLGCGGEATVQNGEGGGGLGGGAAADGGVGGACVSNADCDRFPPTDESCAPGFVAYGCDEITVVPKACSNPFPKCTNCIEWCCPEDISDLELLEPYTVEVLPGPLPPGCTEAPSLNWICDAQGKPTRAANCADEPDFSETECIESAYSDANECTSGVPTLYCCP